MGSNPTATAVHLRKRRSPRHGPGRRSTFGLSLGLICSPVRLSRPATGDHRFGRPRLCARKPRHTASRACGPLKPRRPWSWRSRGGGLGCRRCARRPRPGRARNRWRRGRSWPAVELAAHRQPMDATSTGSLKPFSLTDRRSSGRSRRRDDSSVAALTSTSEPAAAAPMRAARLTPPPM